MTDNHKEHDMPTDTAAPELEAAPDAVEDAPITAGLPVEEPSGYDIQPAADPDEDEDEGPDPEPNAITAFLVITTTDGASFATSDIAKIKEILPQREATIADMRRGCQEVVHDVNAMQTAQQTVGLMQQQAQMMAEEQRNAKIAAKLASKGIHVPQGGRRG